MIGVLRRRVMGSSGGGYPADALMTIETNPEVLAICYAQGWCAHADYMTYSEAAAVTDIGTVFANSNITHFDELEFFGITAVGESAFYATSSLQSMTVPTGVTSIGNRAFMSTSCETLTIKSTNITSWGNVYTFLSTGIKHIYSNSSNTSFPGNLTNLTSIELSSNVRILGGLATSKITGITIPEGLTTINTSCFYQCTLLTEITFPTTLEVFSSAAVRNCSSLTSLTFLATTPPTGADAYTWLSTNNCPIYVPAASVDAYKAASGWGNVSGRIQAIST